MDDSPTKRARRGKAWKFMAVWVTALPGATHCSDSTAERAGGREPADSIENVGADQDSQPRSADDPAEGLDSSPPLVVARYYAEHLAEADRSNFGFFDFPWPSVNRPLSDWASLPNPSAAVGCNSGEGSGLVQQLAQSLDPEAYRHYLSSLLGGHLHQRANHPVVYVAFDGDLAPSHLPSPLASLDSSSPIVLLQLGEAFDTPQRVPVRSQIFSHSHYMPPNTLAVTPAGGFALNANSRYALVVRKTLRDAAGRPLGQAAPLEELLAGAGDTLSEAERNAYRTAAESVHSQLGIEPSSLAALVVFDTGDPGSILTPIRQAVNSLPNPTSQASIVVDAPTRIVEPGLIQLNGSLATPIQQRGQPPYLPKLTVALGPTPLQISLDSENLEGSFLGAAINTSGSGEDSLAPRTERIGFVLTVPETALRGDAARVPLVVFAPGTGGDRNSAVRNGIARSLAELGYATLTADLVMHGQRAHDENTDAQLTTQLRLLDEATGSSYTSALSEWVRSGDLFFNPLSLAAARGNVLQAAVDYLWQGAVFAQSALDIVHEGEPRTLLFGEASFFGHSQGGSTGPLLATSPAYAHYVLSGAGAHIPSIVRDKTEPSDAVDLSGLLQAVICDDPREPLTTLHPVLAALGHWFEPADGEHYADALSTGQPARSVFLLQGFDDHYSPPSGNNALATAARLVELGSSHGRPPTEGQTLLHELFPSGGFKPLERTDTARSSSQGFKRYGGESCTDPHFVYVCNQAAADDWLGFFASAQTGSALIP